jgi:hypothetical protein
MSNQKYYDIEFYMPPPIDKWRKLVGFCYMRKSFAEGAWAMLKSFYNQKHEHRLLCDGVVTETLSKQTIKLN